MSAWFVEQDLSLDKRCSLDLIAPCSSGHLPASGLPLDLTVFLRRRYGDHRSFGHPFRTPCTTLAQSYHYAYGFDALESLLTVVQAGKFYLSYGGCPGCAANALHEAQERLCSTDPQKRCLDRATGLKFGLEAWQIVYEFRWVFLLIPVDPAFRVGVVPFLTPQVFRYSVGVCRSFLRMGAGIVGPHAFRH